MNILSKVSIVAILSLAVVTCFVGATNAHEWYDPYCCNDKDCKTVEAHGAKIEFADKGYLIEYRGYETLVPYGSSKVKPSQDTNIHLCIIQGDIQQDIGIRCIYIPGVV